MTTVVYPSLDDLLRTAKPVEAEPFDLDWYVIQPGTRDEIARYISELRCTIDDRERVAANLEADAARTDALVQHALSLLECAASYAVSEDCASYIDDAMAELRATRMGGE